MRRPPLPCALLLAAALAAGVMACVDATHDAQVAALGGEDPAVPAGPDHRPGQPCDVCHGGEGPAKLQFSVSGTTFMYGDNSSVPASGATVQIEDATGAFWHVTANSVGNFFILKSDWSPVFPITCPSIQDSQGNGSYSMTTLDNRAGSCNACHTLQAGPNSVGPIFVHRSPDGG